MATETQPLPGHDQSGNRTHGDSPKPDAGSSVRYRAVKVLAVATCIEIAAPGAGVYRMAGYGRASNVLVRPSPVPSLEGSRIETERKSV